jgi:predicted  nucleic acid-binding Zn-ribbon protein
LNSELGHLISLQDMDVEIKRLTEEIESLPARSHQLERQFAESFREYLAVKRELEEARKRRRGGSKVNWSRSNKSIRSSRTT